MGIVCYLCDQHSVTEETAVKTLYKYSSLYNSGYKEEAGYCGEDFPEVLREFFPVVVCNV
jgi:hypothetical protein